MEDVEGVLEVISTITALQNKEWRFYCTADKPLQQLLIIKPTRCTNFSKVFILE